MVSLFGRKKKDARPAGGDDLFDEDFTKRLEVLAVVARRIHAGRARAERRSKKTGSGIEFKDHRDYSAGDDFRYLDWSAYGRTDRLLLRLFEEEEDLSVYVLLDCSRSMEHGAPRTKLDYGKQLAAAIAYVALASLDRVAVLTFTDKLTGRLAPTRGKARIFPAFDFLRRAKPDGKTGVGPAMKTFVAQHKRRGVAVLISDLYDPAGFEEGINTLRYHKFEPVVLQVFDPSEVRPKLHGDVLLVDDETGEEREVTVTPALLDKYAKAHAEYRTRIERFCAEKQVAYAPVETSIPFDDAVLALLRRGGLFV